MMGSMLETLRAALAALTDKAYHINAAPNTVPPYLVWMEDGDNDLTANNVHGERCFTGTVDLYTKSDTDPLVEQVPAALEGIGAAWYFNSLQYEEDTGLNHYEWVWEVLVSGAD